MVQNARFGALGVGVAVEGIGPADVVAARSLLVGGVDADVADEEVEQAVAVVVEEDRTGGVPDVPHARRRGDVAEPAAAHVLEQAVAVAHRRDEQIGIPVVVDVGKGAPDGDRVVHAEPRLVGDVLEPAAAQVAPQLVGAELGGEVQVRPPVAVHVGGAQARPVIVMDLLIGLPRIVDDAVLERDAARLALVRESKVVRRGRLGGQCRLLGGTLEQPCGG